MQKHAVQWITGFCRNKEKKEQDRPLLFVYTKTFMDVTCSLKMAGY